MSFHVSAAPFAPSSQVRTCLVLTDELPVAVALPNWGRITASAASSGAGRGQTGRLGHSRCADLGEAQLTRVSLRMHKLVLTLLHVDGLSELNFRRQDWGYLPVELSSISVVIKSSYPKDYRCRLLHTLAVVNIRTWPPASGRSYSITTFSSLPSGVILNGLVWFFRL